MLEGIGRLRSWLEGHHINHINHLLAAPKTQMVISMRTTSQSDKSRWHNQFVTVVIKLL